MQTQTRYQQPADRMTIASMSQRASSKRVTARLLGRTSSTISREIKRNAPSVEGYASHTAQVRCFARRLAARLVLLAKMQNVTAASALAGFSAKLNSIAAPLRRSLTYNQGLDGIADSLNNRPRATHGFNTPFALGRVRTNARVSSSTITLNPLTQGRFTSEMKPPIIVCSSRAAGLRKSAIRRFQEKL